MNADGQTIVVSAEVLAESAVELVLEHAAVIAEDAEHAGNAAYDVADVVLDAQYAVGYGYPYTEAALNIEADAEHADLSGESDDQLDTSGDLNDFYAVVLDGNVQLEHSHGDFVVRNDWLNPLSDEQAVIGELFGIGRHWFFVALLLEWQVLGVPFVHSNE